MSTVADDIRVLVSLGGPLTVSQLAAALDSDPDAVLIACDDLTTKGLLADHVDGLVIDGPEPDGSNARRSLFAERLTSVLAGADIAPERLGRLYLTAGKPDLALPLLAEAASEPSTEHQEAVELLTEAIDAAPRDTPAPTVGSLLLARARRYRNAGLTMPAVEDATEAISHLSGFERVDALALAAVLADDLQHPQESERWAAMALLEAGRLGAHPKFGSLLSLHARELARLGFAREAEAEQKSGLEIAAAEGTELQQFYTLVNAARTELDTGDVRTARVSYEHLRDVALRHEGPVVVADKEAHLARALLLGGDVTAGLAYAESAREAAEHAGAVAVAFLADIALVEGLLAFHRYGEALEVSERIAETAMSSLPAWRNRADGYRGIALVGLGRFDDARREFQRGLEDTPRGGDGLRLRLWLQAWAMTAGPDNWDQHEAENLTDLLLHSGWLQTAAEFMVIRARHERHSEIAAEAAAIAYRLGQPMLAADAVQAGDLWATSAGGLIAERLREVELRLPEEWLRDWLNLSAVQAGLAVDVRDDEEAAQALRLDVERALGGLDSAALSPAQRVSTGAVRRKQRARTAVRTVLQVVLAALVAIAVTLIVYDPPNTPSILENIRPIPDGGLSGSAERAGGPTRAGLLEGTVEKPIGVYWIQAFGGSFRAAPVVFGNTVFVGSSEGRFYSIDLGHGTTNFEEDVRVRIDTAAAVAAVPGFGEGGQSENLAFFGASDGTVIAHTLGDTSEIVWQFEAGGAITGAPVVVGQTVYFASLDGHVYAVDGPGGFEVGRFPDAPLDGGFTEALAIDDSYVYAVGGGDLYMLDLETLKPTCVVDLGARTRVVTHPVVADGAVFAGTSLQTIAVFSPGNCGAPPSLFSPSHQVEVTIRHAPVVGDGVIWMAADELILVLDPVTGGLEAIDVGGVITSPPVLADRSLVMATEGGWLVAVDVDSRSIVWDVEIGSEIRAPVAVVDHVIVVATARGELIALAD